VKGLKIYEDVFTTSEIMKVANFINEIRQAGRNGELSGKLCFYVLKLSLLHCTDTTTTTKHFSLE
jgi:mRNA N6-methyladenine demethylase